MEIYGFSTGRIRPKQAERGLRRWLPGGWSAEPLPVNVFAVTHPDGLLVFDAGQRARSDGRAYLPGRHPFLRLARVEVAPEEEAAVQLGRLGFDAPPRWVALSHLHTDHVAGLAGLGATDVLVARAEWERAWGTRGWLRGYVARDWPRGVAPRLVDFESGGLEPFASAHDVAGDGRLLLVPTPGHTPGHMSLLVRADDGSFLLAGDAAHSLAGLEVALPVVARYCAEERVHVLLTHDPAALAHVRTAR